MCIVAFLYKKSQTFYKMFSHHKGIAMTQYYFANWKTYQSLASVKKFLKDAKLYQDIDKDKNDLILGIASSYEHLYYVKKSLQKSSVLIGAQDCSHHSQGAYTGQVSVACLAELGINFSIIGHSEARSMLMQSHEVIALKCKMLLAASIIPIICIGESLAEYNQGITFQALHEQLEAILEILQSYTGSTSIFIAYEPLYAIGTGIVPEKKALQNVFYFLQSLIEQFPIAKNVMFLYGGSVSSLSISQLQGIDGLSGFLIGKSSIDFQELKKIVESK